ncbi:MAG: fructose PTS transporter subunit IIB [Bacteroidetes bacterium]|nr:fructose PTS transporter subunit IIB [Bacteroidota bacterium]MBU1093748.1 fructose PTS transporter subunit IIB [Bacillota bacterium]
MVKIVCVTACPTGIAHTYMAAEMLEHTGELMGIEVLVETNGAMGVENKLKVKDIEEAIAVIVAADIKVEMKRFIGKPLIEVPVSDAIFEAKALLQDAIDGKYSTY